MLLPVSERQLYLCYYVECSESAGFKRRCAGAEAEAETEEEEEEEKECSP